EQAKARDVRRPAEARRLELMDRDLQRVTRLGPIDIDGAGDRIDLGEVERRDVGNRAVRLEMAGAAVDALELQARAGRHRRHGWDRTIPPIVMVKAVDCVVAVTAHLWRRPDRS